MLKKILRCAGARNLRAPSETTSMAYANQYSAEQIEVLSGPRSRAPPSGLYTTRRGRILVEECDTRVDECFRRDVSVYMPGRRRTGSRPLRTSICSAEYWLALAMESCFGKARASYRSGQRSARFF